jgi:hypothetical protein
MMERQAEYAEMGIDCDIDSNMDSEDIKHMEKAMLFETKLTEEEKNIEF